MANKLFTQEELNCIVTARLTRERQRMTKEFENILSRFMTDAKTALSQDLCTVKRNYTAEMKDTLLSIPSENGKKAATACAVNRLEKKQCNGGCAGNLRHQQSFGEIQ